MSPRVFCSACVGVIQRLERPFIKQETKSLILLHHDSAADLGRAAEGACPICSNLWSQLTLEQREHLLGSDKRYELVESEDVVLPNLERDDDQAWKIRAEALERSLTWVILQPPEEVWGVQDGGDTLSLVVTINAERGLPGKKTVSAQNRNMAMFVLEPMTAELQEEASRNCSTDRDNSTRSSATWRLAESWISDCVEKHTHCNTAKVENWYPTRLLDLAQDSAYVRLVETASEPVKGRYMTLSHRWASSMPLRLLRSTRGNLLKGVKVDQLPQSFRDAIEVCRKLGIKYLWIDCLCIIQDDENMTDWVREAALMHKVYANSFLNVSALAADDSSCTFFADRNAEILDEAFIDTALSPDLSLGSEQQTFRVTDIMFWQSQVSNAHLNLRGWVLQERLLAPRVVHFGREQVFWECREFDAAERYPQGLPKFMTDKLIRVVRFKDLLAHFANDAQRVGSERPYKAWSRIVASYSSCGLTVASDKFVALSGIAKHMAAILDDEYVAGMWRRSLPWELGWSINGDDDNDDGETAKQNMSQMIPVPRRARVYRAPSWSWMSLDVAVSPASRDDRKALIEVLDVQQTFTTDDPTCSIGHAQLIVRARICKVVLKCHPDPDLAWKLLIDAVGKDGTITEVRKAEGPAWERMGPVVTLDEHRAFYDPTATPNDLYLMPLLISSTDRSHAWYLLLEEQPPRSGGKVSERCYRRIGVVVSVSEEEIDVMDRVLSSSSTEGGESAIDDAGDTIVLV